MYDKKHNKLMTTSAKLMKGKFSYQTVSEASNCFVVLILGILAAVIRWWLDSVRETETDSDRSGDVLQPLLVGLVHHFSGTEQMTPKTITTDEQSRSKLCCRLLMSNSLCWKLSLYSCICSIRFRFANAN